MQWAAASEDGVDWFRAAVGQVPGYLDNTVFGLNVWQEAQGIGFDSVAVAPLRGAALIVLGDSIAAYPDNWPGLLSQVWRDGNICLFNHRYPRRPGHRRFGALSPGRPDRAGGCGRG